jgi:hypothetical protein
MSILLSCLDCVNRPSSSFLGWRQTYNNRSIETRQLSANPAIACGLTEKQSFCLNSSRNPDVAIQSSSLKTGLLQHLDAGVMWHVTRRTPCMRIITAIVCGIFAPSRIGPTIVRLSRHLLRIPVRMWSAFSLDLAHLPELHHRLQVRQPASAAARTNHPILGTARHV